MSDERTPICPGFVLYTIYVTLRCQQCGHEFTHNETYSQPKEIHTECPECGKGYWLQLPAG